MVWEKKDVNMDWWSLFAFGKSSQSVDDNFQRKADEREADILL